MDNTNHEAIDKFQDLVKKHGIEKASLMCEPTVDLKAVFARENIKLLAQNKKLVEALENIQNLWERVKPQMKDVEDVGLAKNELNKIIGRTL